MPEVFNYWLQPGRIDVGFLSGAQIDRFGNINTTVIGDYDDADGPAPRLPAAPRRSPPSCRRVIVLMRHQRRGPSSSTSTS